MDGELEISDGEIIFLGRRRCSEDDVVVEGCKERPIKRGGVKDSAATFNTSQLLRLKQFMRDFWRFRFSRSADSDCTLQNDLMKQSASLP